MRASPRQVVMMNKVKTESKIQCDRVCKRKNQCDNGLNDLRGAGLSQVEATYRVKVMYVKRRVVYCKGRICMGEKIGERFV